MKLDRVLNHCRKFMESRREAEKNNHIHAIGENIGNELPRNRLSLLNKTRSELARIRMDDDYGRGYLAAALDIIAAYEAIIEANDDSSQN